MWPADGAQGWGGLTRARRRPGRNTAELCTQSLEPSRTPACVFQRQRLMRAPRGGAADTCAPAADVRVAKFTVGDPARVAGHFPAAPMVPASLLVGHGFAAIGLFADGDPRLAAGYTVRAYKGGCERTPWLAEQVRPARAQPMRGMCAGARWCHTRLACMGCVVWHRAHAGACRTGCDQGSGAAPQHVRLPDPLQRPS
jgi:hypothetical protein